jgi:hypothetical protein
MSIHKSPKGDDQMTGARTFRAFRVAVLIIGFTTAGAVVLLTGETAFVKNNNVGMKTSPENTRLKNGSGKVDSAPRDVATGQASGKRVHKPISILK